MTYQVEMESLLNYLLLIGMPAKSTEIGNSNSWKDQN